MKKTLLNTNSDIRTRSSFAHLSRVGVVIVCFGSFIGCTGDDTSGKIDLSNSSPGVDSSQNTEQGPGPNPDVSYEKDFDISQFTSSKLPIMIIENQLQEIPDEPKILSKMWLINNGEENNLEDNINLDYGYDAEHLFAGIETRGASSSKFEKNSME